MLWRRLRAAGALGLQNGVWLLPQNEAQERFVAEMQAYVQSRNGSAHAFVVQPLTPTVQADLVARFRAVRAEEYFEFREQCADFLAEIEKETAAKNFSFAELEENEEDLHKLDRWLARIRERDVVGGEPSDNADAPLNECHSALEGFAARIYSAESLEPPDSLGGEHKDSDREGPEDGLA
jgi:hypothetical protein